MGGGAGRPPRPTACGRKGGTPVTHSARPAARPHHPHPCRSPGIGLSAPPRGGQAPPPASPLPKLAPSPRWPPPQVEVGGAHRPETPPPVDPASPRSPRPSPSPSGASMRTGPARACAPPNAPAGTRRRLGGRVRPRQRRRPGSLGGAHRPPPPQPCHSEATWACGPRSPSSPLGGGRWRGGDSPGGRKL